MNKVPEELDIIENKPTNSKKKKEKKQKKKIKIDKQLLITIIICSLVLIAFAIYATIKLTSSSRIKYTVTFNTDGGTKIESQLIKKNDTATKPKNPTKEDYIFVRWEYKEKEYDFDKKITNNITLNAIWEEDISDEIFSIMFDSRGGTSVEYQNVNGNGVVIKPEDPTKEHATFEYWEVNGEEYDFSTPVKEDMFIVAKWNEENTLTVSFDSDGGTQVKDQQLYLNDLVTKPTDPTKKDYTFIEWQLDGEKYNFDSPVTKNMILQAKWEKINTFTVTFDIDGTKTQVKVISGQQVTKIADPTKEGCTFNGWLFNNNQFDFSTPITSDITLYASWY